MGLFCKASGGKMSLEKFVDIAERTLNLIKNNPKHFYYSSLAFLTVKGLDITSTYL